MSDLWLPHAERLLGNSAGPMNGDGSRKILLHSTEGSTIAGAVSAYRAHNSWPHMTVDCGRREIVQHLPLNVAARALRNDPGGADETNKDGTILVQIELVGFAGSPRSIGDDAGLEWLGREVLAPIARRTGVPLVSTVNWVAYPASYGKRAAQRLSPAAWDAYSGVLGHQHAPDNDHGDPGAIDIDRILAAAGGATPQEDDMGAVEQRQIDALTELCRRQMILLRDVVHPLIREVRSQVRNDVQQANVVAGVDTALDPDRQSGSGGRRGVRQLASLGVQDSGLDEQLAEMDGLIQELAGDVDALVEAGKVPGED